MQGQSRDDRKVDCQIPHREKESVQKVMTGTCHQRGTAQDIESQAPADFLRSGGRGKGEANETHTDDLRGPTDPPLKMTVSCADEVDQHTSVNRKES
jgi:hypothetical protein